MIKKPTPIKLTAEQNQEIQAQLGTQEISKAAPKSTDPVNFPVFEVPVNSRVLVYVPKHNILDANGVEQLAMDKPIIHPITDGRRFLNYRCISGIKSDAAGLTGECPLCDGTAEPWDLANKIIEQKCKAAGLDPDDKDNDEVKTIRRTAFDDRVVKDGNKYYTFPIVVFETVNNDGKTFAKDEEGKFIYSTQWYTLSEAKYLDTWGKVLEQLDDEPSSPGGMFFVLDYTYTPKRGEPNKRDSARNIQVFHKAVKGSEKMRAMLDEATKDWTPAKAQETVIANQIYSTADLANVADAVLEATRNNLALYATSDMVSAGIGAGADSFKLEEKPEVPSDDEGGAAPVGMDDTDKDMSME